ncbi:hypothetical protein BGX30_015268 [Mortierella sp. GBA39]|nr:hypothetical protein BGX30_015268 [Mortierella sp. GBA39]
MYGFDIIHSISSAPWVGLDHFKEFLEDDSLGYVIKNTLGMSLLKLVIGFPLPILFALLLNEIRSIVFKKWIQTISYLPHFLSWVILGGILATWLADVGIVNKVLMALHLIDQPITYLAEPKYFWSIVVTSDIWKEIGWSAIIYLAAISSVSPELYEAATIDGAGRMQKMWNITLPSIKGTISILFILAVSGILNSNFDQILVLRNSLNETSSNVIDVYVYNVGLAESRYSYAAAVGLIKNSASSAIFEIFNSVLMLIVCFVTLYPIWYVIVNAFNDGADAMRGGIYWWPRQFSLDSFQAVFRSEGIMTAMGVTVAKTLVGTPVHVFFTSMVAYAFSRRELVGRKLYMFIGTVTMFFGGGLIPYYLLIRDLHLLDNFLVYIIPAAFSFFDLIIFLSFFREIPPGLEEAAKIDGANDFKIFYKVIIPVSMPVVATIALFHGVYQWNDYFTGMIFINDTNLQPIQTYLYRVVAQSSSNQMLASMPSGMAVSVTSQSLKLATMVVTTAPIVFVYPFLQKYFVKGFMIGSIKE